MHPIVHLGVLALTIFGLSRFLPGVVQVRGVWAAVVVAVVFSVLNFFLGFLLTWLVRVVLVVPGLLTLGLVFLLVPLFVNAILLWMTDKMMASFAIRSTGGLFLTALVITVVNGFFATHATWSRLSAHGAPHWV